MFTHHNHKCQLGHFAAVDAGSNFRANRAEVAVESFENRVGVGRVCRVGNGDCDE